VVSYSGRLLCDTAVDLRHVAANAASWPSVDDGLWQVMPETEPEPEPEAAGYQLKLKPSGEGKNEDEDDDEDDEAKGKAKRKAEAKADVKSGDSENLPRKKRKTVSTEKKKGEERKPLAQKKLDGWLL
jgi:hypothetical protein